MQREPLRAFKGLLEPGQAGVWPGRQLLGMPLGLQTEEESLVQGAGSGKYRT